MPWPAALQSSGLESGFGVLLAAVAFDVRNKIAGKPSIIGAMSRRFSKDKAEPVALTKD